MMEVGILEAGESWLRAREKTGAFLRFPQPLQRAIPQLFRSGKRDFVQSFIIEMRRGVADILSNEKEVEVALHQLDKVFFKALKIGSDALCEDVAGEMILGIDKLYRRPDGLLKKECLKYKRIWDWLIERFGSGIQAVVEKETTAK